MSQSSGTTVSDTSGTTGFSDIGIGQLDALPADGLDALPYGVVGLSADGTTELYNVTESKFAGLPRSIVVGWNYFGETAQCMNNFMVAQRFEDEPEIDDVIDYVLTLRMRPTPVRLRLLKSPSSRLRYLLIQR